MLDTATIQKMEDFVCLKPRSIDEMAKHIGRNWRTADRYIQHIEKEFGTMTTRTFREGTRGALKIVYWTAIEKFKASIFQDRLEQQIMQGRGKKDFSAFDIFQHVSQKDKAAWMRVGEEEDKLGKLSILKNLLLTAKKQILFFSGNLSFINYKYKDINIFNTLEELVKKGIQIKIVSRVDIAGLENIQRLLSLNNKYGKELVQIRHAEQPLRVTIIDDKHMNIKEIKEPTGRIKELNKRTFIFYDIKDKDWISWLRRIFFKMFNSSIDSHRRIEEIKKIK